MLSLLVLQYFFLKIRLLVYDEELRLYSSRNSQEFDEEGWCFWYYVHGHNAFEWGHGYEHAQLSFHKYSSEENQNCATDDWSDVGLPESSTALDVALVATEKGALHGLKAKSSPVEDTSDHCARLDGLLSTSDAGATRACSQQSSRPFYHPEIVRISQVLMYERNFYRARY